MRDGGGKVGGKLVKGLHWRLEFKTDQSLGTGGERIEHVGLWKRVQFK